MVVAAETSALIGYALFYPYFASFRGQRGVYLEDIYISTDIVVGESASIVAGGREAASNAGANGSISRCSSGTSPAISFYEKLGADRNDDERHFKFSDAAFRRLAGQGIKFLSQTGPEWGSMVVKRVNRP